MVIILRGVPTANMQTTVVGFARTALMVTITIQNNLMELKAPKALKVLMVKLESQARREVVL
jgi:hypothetical protein